MNPLQIFEKHPAADAYRVGGFYSPYALVSTDKRFTDAELAADVWSTRSEELELRRDGYDACSTVEQGEVLYRFATLPHFDA